MSFAEFGGPKSPGLSFEFRERPPEFPDSPISYLTYSSINPDWAGLTIRLPYSGTPRTVEFGGTEDALIEIREMGVPGYQWVSIQGRATIHGESPDGTLRVDFADVVLRPLAESITRPVASGFVEGKVTRSCYFLQGSQHVWDGIWSSPFCASVKPD